MVDPGGDFSFGTDAGTFDVRVEPDPGTGFGWLVRPGVTIDGSAASTDLGRLAVAAAHRLQRQRRERERRQ